MLLPGTTAGPRAAKSRGSVSRASGSGCFGRGFSAARIGRSSVPLGAVALVVAPGAVVPWLAGIPRRPPPPPPRHPPPPPPPCGGQVSTRVNGGYNGLEGRTKLYARALTVWADDWTCAAQRRSAVLEAEARPTGNVSLVELNGTASLPYTPAPTDRYLSTSSLVVRQGGAAAAAQSTITSTSVAAGGGGGSSSVAVVVGVVLALLVVCVCCCAVVAARKTAGDDTTTINAVYHARCAREHDSSTRSVQKTVRSRSPAPACFAAVPGRERARVAPVAVRLQAVRLRLCVCGRCGKLGVLAASRARTALHRAPRPLFWRAPSRRRVPVHVRLWCVFICEHLFYKTLFY